MRTSCASILLAWSLASTLAGQTTPTHPGQVVFGTHRYVEYIAGNAPLILAMPHGGYLRPPTVKDRTWGVTTQDGRTQETGREIVRKFRAAFGLHPHVVINHLHRIKLDANRDIVEAAQGDKTAEQAWREFHGYIAAARQTATSRYGKGLFLDLHGHGHPIDWVELGYLLSATVLNRSDNQLNNAATIASSSLRSLAAANPRKPFAELLRGKSSLGGLLENRGLMTVPAPKIPGPGSNSYFRGGYDTQRWGSRNGGRVDGIQIELPSSMRRNLGGRDRFTSGLVSSLGDFFAFHYGIKLGDGARVTVAATAVIATEAGDPAEFTVTRTGDLSSPLAVPVLVGGRGTAGLDYARLPTSVTIPAQESAVALRVVPVQDSTSEGQETIVLTLLPISGPGAPRIGFPNTATAILVDDELDPLLLGHWALDERSGTLARDRSGNNRHASLLPVNGGPGHVTGRLTGALSFDEIDDRMLVPDFDYAGGIGFTLSFWFRAPPSSQGSTQYLFSHGGVLGPNSLNVYRFESTGLLRTWLRCRTDVNSSILLDVAQDFMDDRWHSYVLCVEPQFVSASVYIDGRRLGFGRIGGDRLDPPGSIHLGARQDLSSTRFLRGRVDDVMLQARHLTEPEVAELFAGSTGYARPFGTGCKTSRGVAPVQTMQGAPAPGASVRFEVTRAAPATSGAFYFGFSRSRLGGAALPLDLQFLGAPGCDLLQDAVLSAAVGVAQGMGSLQLTVPGDPALRGLRIYSQAMVLDSGANPAGIAVSNGVDALLGG